MGVPRGMGMGGNFVGQWEGPGMMRGGSGGPIATEHHLVPANRTGLVIGKGNNCALLFRCSGSTRYTISSYSAQFY